MSEENKTPVATDSLNSLVRCGNCYWFKPTGNKILGKYAEGICGNVKSLDGFDDDPLYVGDCEQCQEFVLPKNFIAEQCPVCNHGEFSRKSESAGSVPTNRERLLMEALHATLIACGVLLVESTPNGPELLCAAECFCKGKKQNRGIHGKLPHMTALNT